MQEATQCGPTIHVVTNGKRLCGNAIGGIEMKWATSIYPNRKRLLEPDLLENSSTSKNMRQNIINLLGFCIPSL